MGWFKRILGSGGSLMRCPRCGSVGLRVPRLPDTATCPNCQTQCGCLVEIGQGNEWVEKLALCLKCGGTLVPVPVDTVQRAFDEAEEKTILSDPSTSGTIWRSHWVHTKCTKCGETKKVPVSRPRS